jgi:hypothetical protein
MLGVFAVWAGFGFGYPSDPASTTLNIVSKILAFVTVLTLFLRRQPATEQASEEPVTKGPGTEGPGTEPTSRGQAWAR